MVGMSDVLLHRGQRYRPDGVQQHAGKDQGLPAWMEKGFCHL